MKTTLERALGKTEYGQKELVMRLVQVEGKQVIGHASVDLAKYHNCSDRKLFSVELANCQFPDGLIEFYLTASPVAGSARPLSTRQKSPAHGMIGASNKLVQSARNSGQVKSLSNNDNLFG